MTSLRNIESKFVVKLQHFGTERDKHKQKRFLLYHIITVYTASVNESLEALQ